MSTKTQNMLHLRVELEHLNLPVWRDIIIDPSATLEDLHYAIQAIFGWEDYQQHEFQKDGKRYGYIDPEGDGDEEWQNEANIAITDVLANKEESIEYTYDFADHWHHKVTLMGFTEPKSDAYVECIDGKNACPPEDAGGVAGYEHLLNVLRSPNHFEHEEVKEWFGEGFSPNRFSVAEANASLQDSFTYEDE